ncbi:MAG: ATP-grasp domain-containing protein, partial [Micromonosporaceae bacterium]|nr:ATP-grasp domain-containing protein [Micromonosporaceae bacterium]
MFRRIAIVNRGEAAMRLIRAVRELNAERGSARAGAPPIETIALYTDGERSATFVREADHSYCLGPASARPYLDHAVLARALVETGADAAWVGWGFVAEDPAFAELCEKHGVTFIGPSAEAMRKLGDKIGAKLIAEEVGVPVAPWSRGAVDDLDAAMRAADEIGYPLMLKATAGGGGRGIRIIHSAAELAEAYERTRLEAERAFGSGVVFLERLVTGARHVEVQIIADGQGTAWALGVRDCTVQRRNQKIIEESASPVLDPQQVADLKAAAERLALAVDYTGAGTVEFLYHPGDRMFAFLEVNTRLQVEHPITEVTTDVDLVKAQLHVAAGGRLGDVRPTEVGHAVEARLNAEDPDRDFAPAPGRIERLILPSGPGIRVDTGFSEGDVIPADFDSMIAKIIAYGRTREEALGRLRRAVAETTVIIEGGATNKSFLLDLLDEPAVLDGTADTGWIDRVRGQGGLVTTRHAGVALAAAAIEAYENEAYVERQRLLTTAHGGRPQVQHVSGRPIDLKLRGTTYRVRVAQIGPRRFRIGIENPTGPANGSANGGTTVDAEIERFDEHTGLLLMNGHRFRLVTDTHGPIHLVEVDGVTHRIGRDEGGVVRSPAPALVVATPVQVGDEVEAGAPVLVLESMKMETVLRAPVTAVVRECLVSVGSQVGAGAPLLRLEPIGAQSAAGAASTGRADGDPTAAGDDLRLPPEPVGRSAQERVARGLADLRSLLLGYDVDPRDEGRLLTDYLAARAELDQRPLEGEVELLQVFADLAELSRNRPAGEETRADHRVHSPREYFHIYLQSLDVDRAGLPDAFRARLARVLAHYGVDSFDRTPALEEAVFRIFLAQQRASADSAVIVALLQQWLTEPPPGDGLRQIVGQALEHLIFATQLRFPAVGDLARGVVFRWAAQPMLRRRRAEVYASVRRHLRYLDQNPSAPDRAERIAAMVATPEPLVRLLAQRIGRPGVDHGPMLEVLSRRYYGNRGLSQARCVEMGGHVLFTAQYDRANDDRDGERFGLIAAAADWAGLPAVLAQVAELATPDTVADVYLSWPDQPDDPDAMSAILGEVLDRTGLLTVLSRVTISVAGRTGSAMHHHVTFRPGAGEDRLIRGLHPLIAERLQLPRLRHFDLTRLPSADEEVYVFHCVAHDNPADERFVAMAQVRDLSPLRDADGRVLALPAVEGALAACLDAIRTAQAQRGRKQRLDTNRITIYVWPPSDLSMDDLNTVARRLLPMTADAGLEEVLFLGRQRDPSTGRLTDIAVRVSYDGGMRMTVTEPTAEPIQPLDDYRQKVLAARRRGATYPYELTDLLAGPRGRFVEYDLAEDGTLVPVERPKGQNVAGIVTGVVTTPTERYPEGVTRVVLFGDPTRSLGALAEPECSRVIAALDLAERMRVPVEWFALSSGARISMTSGTENMDWVAAALKRIVQFTQAGGEINIVVAGITVGAQPYWNAEATMLMHTKGILVMTPDSAMVLTGKQSLDFSGGVSAEDNFGIGGYDRVMGPNGQAQYWAPDLRAACEVLLAHYDHTYIAPGETRPRRAVTTDPTDRNVCEYPHSIPDSDFTTVGEIFSAQRNPDRKKPFDIRTVMRAVSDQDHPVLERWAGMADAETAVVQDVHLGGYPVCLIGIESRSVPRRGFPPTDGPDTYTAGTLFPRSSKKVARAINAASGNRPVVVLANLSGFDGSPESMRLLQLEYGAEIGRAIVNF